MVEQRSREQYTLTRQLQAWAPAVALAAGLLLLGARAGMPVRLLRDALLAFAYGCFAFAAADTVERVLNGLSGPRSFPPGPRGDTPVPPLDPDGPQQLSTTDRQ